MPSPFLNPEKWSRECGIIQPLDWLDGFSVSSFSKKSPVANQ